MLYPWLTYTVLNSSLGIIGAAHLRDIFYRMGLSDKDIVALSGGHTLVVANFLNLSLAETGAGC